MDAVVRVRRESSQGKHSRLNVFLPLLILLPLLADGQGQGQPFSATRFDLPGEIPFEDYENYVKGDDPVSTAQNSVVPPSPPAPAPVSQSFSPPQSPPTLPALPLLPALPNLPPHTFPTLPPHTFPTLPPHTFPTFPPHTFPTLPPHSFPTLPPHTIPTLPPHTLLTLPTHTFTMFQPTFTATPPVPFSPPRAGNEFLSPQPQYQSPQSQYQSPHPQYQSQQPQYQSPQPQYFQTPGSRPQYPQGPQVGRNYPIQPLLNGPSAPIGFATRGASHFRSRDPRGLQQLRSTDGVPHAHGRPASKPIQPVPPHHFENELLIDAADPRPNGHSAWFSDQFDTTACRADLGSMERLFKNKFPASLQKTGKDVSLASIVASRIFECERKGHAGHWEKVDNLISKIQLSKSEESECRAGMVQERISCYNLMNFSCQFVSPGYQFRMVPARITVHEARQAEAGADKCRKVVKLVKKRLEG